MHRKILCQLSYDTPDLAYKYDIFYLQTVDYRHPGIPVEIV